MIPEILKHDVFNYNQLEKERLLFKELNFLHNYHLLNSKEYQKLFKKNDALKSNLIDFPFLPVSSFKNHNLYSVNKENIVKTLTSSGTSGGAVSKIHLDKYTANLQSLALSKIFGKILGDKRLPMLIVDTKKILKNRREFSARGAGILGIFPFGKDHTFCLNDDLNLNTKVIESFVEKYRNQKIIIFGFTFLVWSSLMKSGLKIDFSNSILVHSGGWKKLISQGISNSDFRKKLATLFNITDIYNYYGMVEQVGTVFIESEDDSFISPVFSDIIIRDPKTLNEAEDGSIGLVQIVSCLPKSYPGHSILTEDLGYIIPRNSKEDKKRFRILGRAKKAEIRGCSDTLK